MLYVWRAIDSDRPCCKGKGRLNCHRKDHTWKSEEQRQSSLLSVWNDLS